MKQWTVTYREKSGLKTSVVIEAEDRAGVFAELKQRGINAISVTEGVVKTFKKAKERHAISNSGTSFKWCGLIAAAIVLLIAGVVLWWVLPKEEPVAKIKAVEEKVEVKVEKTKVETRSNSVADTSPVEKVVPKKTKEEQLMEGKNPEDWRIIKGKDGEPRAVRVFRPSRSKDKTPPIFSFSSENAISRVLQSDPGERIIGITINDAFRKDLKEALKKEIVIGADDTEEVRLIKEAMIEAKKLLREADKAGEDPCSLVQEAINERNRIATFKEDLVQQIADAKRNGASEEELDELRTVANMMLEEKGAKLIQSPAERIKRFKLKRQENQEKGVQR